MLRFANKRKPRSHTELTDLERDQLIVAGKMWDGEDLAAEARLDPQAPAEWEDPNFSGYLEIWDLVEEESRPMFTAMRYKVDGGVFFKAGTTVTVGEIIQGGLECTSKEVFQAIVEALEAAKEHDGEEYPRIGYRR